MAASEAHLLQALQAVVDPETGRDFVSTKRLRNLRIQTAAIIADIKRCKELQPTFAPDTRAFSPAFLEFYQRDGVAPQSAARAQ